MRTVFIPLLHILGAAVRSRAALHLDTLALRQQLAVLHYRGSKRPHLGPVDRSFWACLSKLWPGWRNPLIIVKPDTVVASSREGFRPLLDLAASITSTCGPMPELPSRARPAWLGSASTHKAECGEQRILFVLPLLPDVHTRSYRCVASFRGRADRRTWRPRTPFERPNGVFVNDKQKR